MKKKVAYVHRVIFGHDSTSSENLLLWRFNRVVAEGYALPIHDFNCYAALLIKQHGLENLPQGFRNSLMNGEKIKQEIQFEFTRLKILAEVGIENQEFNTFYDHLKLKVAERKTIIRKEIDKTQLPGKIKNVISAKNSKDYAELLRLTSAFSDITLIDWFVPIILKYERLIHIFVRHVEETKFAESSTPKRTFFSYESDEIWTLLKRLLKEVEEEIKEHYLLGSVEYKLGKIVKMKPYNRTERNPILFDDDKFVLEIDKNGFIMKFHQI